MASSILVYHPKGKTMTSKQEQFKKLQKWAWDQIEEDHNIEDILYIESNITNDIGYLILDNRYPENCHCDDCLSNILVFRMRHFECDNELLLGATYSEDFYNKIKDKTNDGNLTVKGSIFDIK
jgi:hypothetical protein